MNNILTGNFIEEALMTRWEHLADNNMFGATHNDDSVMQEFIEFLAEAGVNAELTAGEIIDEIVINYVILDLTDTEEVAQYDNAVDDALFITSDNHYAIMY